MICRRSRTRLELAFSPPARSRRHIFYYGAALLAALAAGCGGQSRSTDTGNPPVVIAERLRLTASQSGVVISGSAGAVAKGTQVEVVDVASGQKATTTAKDDGSFEVAVDGSMTDAYRVYATNGSQSSHTLLTSSGAAAPQAGLAGLEYLLQSAQGYTPVSGTTIRISFRDTELSFSAGCNSYSGSYSLCNGALCVSELGGTDMACDQARQAQDTWLAGFLSASPRLTQAGAALTLEGADATLQFLDREVANPDRPLTGRTWTIDTLISDGAASSIPGQVTPTLQFKDDGSLSAFTTCNAGSGSYTRSGQTLTLSNVAYTLVGCGSSGNATVEERIENVIQTGEVTFTIDASRLTIMRGTLGLAATTE